MKKPAQMRKAMPDMMAARQKAMPVEKGKMTAKGKSGGMERKAADTMHPQTHDQFMKLGAK